MHVVMGLDRCLFNAGVKLRSSCQRQRRMSEWDMVSKRVQSVAETGPPAQGM